MAIRMDIRYSDDERAVVEAAVKAANEELNRVWQNNGQQGRKYSVCYIELSAQRWDPSMEEMLADPLNYLAADARDS